MKILIKTDNMECVVDVETKPAEFHANSTVDGLLKVVKAIITEVVEKSKSLNK